MKKQAAMIAICGALLICVAAAGCTSSTSSSPNASAAANSSSQTTTASATPTPTPTPPPAHLTVLFFYEPDCPYCQALESTTSFHQLENTSKVTVTPIESYTSSLTDQYNVTTIPTLILLNNGHEVSRYVDPTDASAINAQIASLLNPG
ncbi:MAG: thioredoxin family protein [Halobacteriota archaeon]|jgi:thioredoxin-like negative regulator of GroEL